MSKLTKLLLIIGSSIICIGIIVTLIVYIVSANKSNKNDDTENGNNTNISNTNTTNTNTNTTTKINDTAVTGHKGTTLDYYWNIDTSKFDASIFNGNINFFGTIVSGKITTNSLKKAGIETTLLGTDKTTQYPDLDVYYASNEFTYSVFPYFTSNSQPIETANNRNLELINYTKSTAIYSDDTLIVPDIAYVCNLEPLNILPEQLGVESYNDITIDLVLEKLGNPTYVQDRKSTAIDTLYSYTTYVYEYDDVVFVYMFKNWTNLSLATAYYYPIEQYSRASIYEKLKTDYQTYLQSAKNN